MNMTRTLLLLLLFFSLSACGGSNSKAETKDTPTTQETNASTKDSNSETSTQEQVSFVPENEDEIIKYATVKIDNLVVQVHQNTFANINKMYDNLNRMLHSFDAMNKRVLDTLDLSMKLVNTLAQPVAITSQYTNIFAISNTYTATSPAFVLKSTLKEKYFLVSSVTPFFIERRTIKSYFFDETTLTKSWSNAISSADKEKNLYLSVVEIDKDGVLHKVSNALCIKSAKLKTL